MAKNIVLAKMDTGFIKSKVPMDLRDENWNAYGRCVITKYTLGEGKTIGTYVLVKIFDKIQGEQVPKAFVSDEEVDAVLSDIK
ncbi:hypothetical protein KKA93_02145 [Patescibacteria group bacterium]|nr:hypothetical protein [Patescibacteria group bacterium]MBU1933900.1 hypothetical protein [Patescibacteria group bacterium]